VSVRRVAPTIAVVAVFYAIFVPLRLVQHDTLWFVHPGKVFVTTGHTSPFLSHLRYDAKVGYDGELYFGLAADPRHAKDYIGPQAGVVYSRVGYPAVSYAVAGGQRSVLPGAMLAVNLVALLAATIAIALWLVRRGLPPWPAAFYGLYPGIIFTVFFDLTEPLAFAFATVGVLVLDTARPRRVALSALLLACAVLTRETTVPFALAAAATLWSARAGARRWPSALAYLAATIVPLLVWRVFVGRFTHRPTQETTHTPYWYVPFRGFLDWRPLDGEHRLILLAIVLPAVVAGCAALVQLAGRRDPIAAGLLLLNVLLYVVYLPKGVYIDYPAASRAVIGVLVSALYCLPAWWRRGIALRTALAGEALAWSLAWFVFVAWKYGLPTIDALTA